MLPDCPILTCWNHLRGDVKHWLTQNKVPSDNISLYLHQLKQMLHCESAEAFLELSENLTSKWAADVASYFPKELKSDILERSSGITNNLSESYNAVLKQENEWKELPVDMLVLGFHFLQTFEHCEIMRGMASIGDYHLKAEFSRASIPLEEMVLPKKLVAPSDIISYLKTHAQDTQENKSSVLDQSSDKDASVPCTKQPRTHICS